MIQQTLALDFIMSWKLFHTKTCTQMLLIASFSCPATSWKMFFATEKLSPDNAMEVNSEKWASRSSKEWRGPKHILYVKSQPENYSFIMIPNTWHSRRHNIIKAIKMAVIKGKKEQETQCVLDEWNDRVFIINLSKLTECAPARVNP